MENDLFAMALELEASRGPCLGFVDSTGRHPCPDGGEGRGQFCLACLARQDKAVREAAKSLDADTVTCNVE
jgi:hypothetical protein